MEKRRPHVPIGLPIAVVALLILGAVANPIISSIFTEQQLNTNVLLSAIPFVCIFAAIVLAFITLVAFVASLLNHNISREVYRPIELALIGGIVLGVVGMFQPWFFIAYRVGFFVLLFSTLGFILWSHVIPKGVEHSEEVGGVSISEYEQSHSG
jgi:mannose/fructose/N-acetylgalactosamine-specific phosphotransferase system component IIC